MENLINQEWLNNIENSSKEFIFSLKKENDYRFNPAKRNLTYYGNNLELGFSCFALKIYYILGLWDKLENKEKASWLDYINSFQVESKKFPNNSYIDKILLENYTGSKYKNFLTDNVKTLLNIFPQFEFEKNKTKMIKAINADTKQAISTIYQVDNENDSKVENTFTESQSVADYLDKFDWTKPWNAGAQFSSLCVYSTTQHFDIKKELNTFINKKVDQKTGSYFSETPKSTREIINGAMKVISGLDWIDEPIHYPEQLINFCINNKPVLEGCDVVDYVYVLFKCSQQTNYKKNEVNQILLQQLLHIQELYQGDDGGFSYFTKSSQTHYYGAEIIHKTYQADIHGTLLCLWAITMILKNIELDKLDFKWNLIKP